MKVLCDFVIAREDDSVLFDRVVVTDLIGSTALPEGFELADNEGKVLTLLQPMTEYHVRIAAQAKMPLLVAVGSLACVTARMQKFWRDGENLFVETQNRRLQFLPAAKPGLIKRFLAAITA